MQDFKTKIMEEFDNNLPICEYCRGEGNWLSECCSGQGCPCQGRPYFPSKCDACNGSGKDIKSFISKTIDQTVEERDKEILACLPKKKIKGDLSMKIGFNICRNQFLFDLTSAGLLIKDKV